MVTAFDSYGLYAGHHDEEPIQIRMLSGQMAVR